MLITVTRSWKFWKKPLVVVDFTQYEGHAKFLGCRSIVKQDPPKFKVFSKNTIGYGEKKITP